jgi:flagellar P-ring protein precursor FlgI
MNQSTKPLVRRLLTSLCSLALLAGLCSPAHALRVKDVASVAGVRSNQLVGYGLVVGLPGTGDQVQQAQFTIQTIRNMLAQFGVVLPDNINPQMRNVAAVTVHAELPPFTKAGQTIDVTVSSIGNASSLRGGSLLMTPLVGADNEVYALAQGNLIVSGIGAQGADGSRITVNIPSSGRIPGGAIVEKEVKSSFGSEGAFVVLNLHQTDFSTLSNLTQAINAVFGPGSAEAIDGGSVHVRAPSAIEDKVAFVAELENLEVEMAQGPARVVVNSRTGTVVIGQQVVLEEAAVAHGNLTVTISETLTVSQPGPFSEGGETVVAPQSNLAVEEENNRMFLFNPGVTLDELVRAVNQVGAAPSDLVAILEALKQVGALRAQLIVI